MSILNISTKHRLMDEGYLRELNISTKHRLMDGGYPRELNSPPSQMIVIET